MTSSTGQWSRYLEVGSASDVGMRRRNNQDSVAIALASNEDRWRARGHLLMVADGMGAHAAGELASSMATEQVPRLYNKYHELSAPEALKRAVVEANAEINRKGQANEDFFHMGTTCSILTLLPQGAVVAHVGDSRVYRLRGAVLEQLTFDHSLVWEMRASGQIPPDDDSAAFIPKNVITRSLGPYPDVKVDLEGPFPIEVGDIYLVCSDGLTGQVSDREIGPLLANLPPNQVVNVLVDLANLRGGPDNISVVVAKVVDARLATPRAATRGLVLSGPASQRMLPALWGAAALGAVATLAIRLLTESWLTALVPGVFTIVLLAYLVATRASSRHRRVDVGSGRRFGRGPYIQVNCGSGETLLSQLQKITDELQKAADDADWQLDFDRLHQLVEKAQAANRRHDQSGAIRHYAACITYIMERLRQTSPADSSDVSDILPDDDSRQDRGKT